MSISVDYSFNEFKQLLLQSRVKPIAFTLALAARSKFSGIQNDISANDIIFLGIRKENVMLRSREPECNKIYRGVSRHLETL